MPLLCCILATKDRPHFLARAIAYYWQQTLTDTELIIVDDGAESCETHVPRTPDITYLCLREKTSLGAKLNLGIEASSGRIIQKLDDDYYHPLLPEDHGQRTPGLRARRPRRSRGTPAGPPLRDR